jgi:hypothetical protein
MIIGSRLRRSEAAANLGLRGVVYDNRPFEAIPYYHIIVADFDYLHGNIALHTSTFWDRLLHLLFPLRRIILQHKLLPNLPFNQSDWCECWPTLFLDQIG